MIEQLMLVGYLLTCLWGFRFAAGCYISDMTQYDGTIAGDDIVIGLVVGAAGALIAPVMLPVRLVYVVWQKFIAGNKGSYNVITTMFPPPKKIETKVEKRNRLEREHMAAEYKREEEIYAQRREINQREKELGLELTKW